MHALVSIYPDSKEEIEDEEANRWVGVDERETNLWMDEEIGQGWMVKWLP